MAATKSRDDKRFAGFFGFLFDLLSEKQRATVIISKCLIDLASTLSLGWNKAKIERNRDGYSFFL